MGMAAPPPEQDHKNAAAAEQQQQPELEEVKVQITAHHHHHDDSPKKAKRPLPPPPSPFKKHKPWLVQVFVGVNVILFFLAMFINNCPRNSDNCWGQFVLGRLAFQSLKENPLLGPSGSTLQLMGALDVKKIVEEHQVWRLVTCSWLHAGLLHVAANMLGLILVGVRLEEEFGPERIGLLYVISGVGGSLFSSIFIRHTISVGASGALFGLLGGMLSELLTNWTIYANKLAALLTLILVIVLNLAIGILPHVDNFAHVGGFFTGFLLGFVILIRPQYAWVKQKHSPPTHNGTASQPKYKTYQFVMLGISLAVLISAFVLGLVLLLRGVDGNEHCPWCRYFSCIPTPLWKCKPNQVYCESTMFKNRLEMKCLTNGHTNTYMLESDNNTSALQMLCTQLCSE